MALHAKRGFAPAVVCTTCRQVLAFVIVRSFVTAVSVQGLNNLAVVYTAQGRVAEALQLLQGGHPPLVIEAYPSPPDDQLS